MPKGSEKFPDFLRVQRDRRSYEMRISVAKDGHKVDAVRMMKTLKTRNEAEAIRRRNLIVASLHKSGKLPMNALTRCKRLGIIKDE